MKEKLQAALLAHHPTLKPLLAARYVDKYVDVVLKQIAWQYAHITTEDTQGRKGRARGTGISHSGLRAQEGFR